MELKINKSDYKKKQDEEYKSALKNDDYNSLVKKLKLDSETAKENTVKLFDTLEELSNCKNCKNLYECKNKVKGHVFFPEKKESKLVFSYIPCKYQKKADKLVKETNQSILDNAKIKDITKSDNRYELIKYIINYLKDFNPNITTKGIYLHGNFGTGKSFILAALLNELRGKYNISTEIVYFPELLRKLKEDLREVGDRVYYLENVEVLLLDDIGAEKVTEWGRDEILGTILQTRMNNGMPTFFTSNLNISELERHLSLTKENEDIVKAKRIIERIKYLTKDIELLGNNYRE